MGDLFTKNMTFKTLSYLFIGLLFLLVFINLVFPFNFLFFLFPVVVYFTIVGIKSSQISSGFHLSAICSGPANQKEIAITFDDGPHEEITPEVLKVLNEYNVRATFFCIGKHIKGNETTLVRMKREGHIIGNHTFSHAYLFDFFPATIVKKELDKTNETIHRIINKTPRFFRPPYGVTNPAISKAVKKSDFDVIGWNVRSLDTVIKDESKIFKRVTENLKGGDIVLFHDSNRRVVQVLQSFLKFTSQNGFKIVGLDELIKKSPYA